MLLKTTFCFIILCSPGLYAQNNGLNKLPLKISHAEPVYIDMIRDLGARKGEKEMNVGWEANDKNTYLEQGGFLEYEFSPLERLGLEIEIPFTYRYVNRDFNNEPLPREKIQGIKLASQYTFLVSEKYRISMAIGAIYELKLHSFFTMSENRTVLNGEVLNPFLIVAKRLGKNIHSLIYMGPVFQKNRYERSVNYQANLSLHYVLPKAGHFIGLETNHACVNGNYEMTFRPQVKIKLDQQIALGLVTGIPLYSKKSGLSFMLRFIYEPRQVFPSLSSFVSLL